MQELSLVISREAPAARNIAWLQPVEEGFILKIPYNGRWIPLKIEGFKEEVKDNKTDIDALKAALIGSVQDKETVNTINGVRNYAKKIEKQIEFLEDKTGYKKVSKSSK